MVTRNKKAPAKKTAPQARRRVEQELEKKAAALARSNEELRQFAYVASHDLREPLRVIANYAQLLNQSAAGKLDAKERDFLKYITDGAEMMRMLLADLLSYSQVSLKEKELAQVDFNRVIQQVLLNLEPAIRETEAEIVNGRLPEVVADASQMIQLFQNLIGNALKYRGRSRPRVEISAQKTDGAWLFAVKDNGLGIAPEFHQRIFVIFERLYNKDEYPGTGVGLAICKKIVEKHGGRIWLESKEGTGAAFKFTLPIRGAEK